MNCQSHHVQPLGRVETNGPSVRFLPARGPPVTSNCAECNGAFALGGPFWIDPIHDNSFLELVCFHADTFDVAVIPTCMFPSLHNNVFVAGQTRADTQRSPVQEFSPPLWACIVLLARTAISLVRHVVKGSWFSCSVKFKISR